MLNVCVRKNRLNQMGPTNKRRNPAAPRDPVEKGTEGALLFCLQYVATNVIKEKQNIQKYTINPVVEQNSLICIQP